MTDSIDDVVNRIKKHKEYLLDIKNRCPQQWYESFTKGENIMNFRQLMNFLVEQMKKQYLDYSVSDLDCDFKMVDSDTCIEKYTIRFERDKRHIATIVFEMHKILNNYRENLIIHICRRIVGVSFLTKIVDISDYDLQYFEENPYDFWQKINYLVLDFLVYKNTDNSYNELFKMSRMHCRMLLNSVYGIPREWSLKIKKVIFNEPATIVFWENGCKTVVKCQDNEPFDPEKGLAMAIVKYALGNEGNYYNTFAKYLPKEDKTNEKNNN